MRITVSLDREVAAKLKQAARERGVPFTEVINTSTAAWLAEQ